MREWISTWRATIAWCLLAGMMIVGLVRQEQIFDSRETHGQHTDTVAECQLRVDDWSRSHRLIAAFPLSLEERAKLDVILGPKPDCETR